MKSLIFAVALGTVVLGVLPLEGCATKPLQLAASFSPNPPTRGIERMTILLTDASGRPVDGATVTVATNMPSMSMNGPSAVATAEGDGRYVATLKLAFATRWAFTIAARKESETRTRTILQTVR